jgi:septal ring factor EnvC (AmiA/AmiB activator)
MTTITKGGKPMKQQNAVLFLLLIAFLLITIGTGLGWFALHDQVQQLESVKSEQVYMKRRIAMFKDNLEQIDSQMKTTVDDFQALVTNLKTIEQAVSASRAESQEIASTVSSLSNQFGNWEILYGQLRNRIGALRQDFLSYNEKTYKDQVQIQEDLERVELGEISVEKQASVKP